MSDEFKFWTHGVNAMVESEDDLAISRSSAGLIVQSRAANARTWIHFAIPSATRLDDDAVDIFHAWLMGWLGDDTEIETVAIKMASANVSENHAKMEPVEVFRTPPGEVVLSAIGAEEFGLPFSKDFNIQDRLCTGPIVLSALVRFVAAGKELRLTGAGARFEEHY